MLSKVLDNLAYAVSPLWGAKRLLARKAYERADRKMTRSWEAADNDRFRGKKWLTSGLSPDSALEEDLETLRERSQDLCRNDKWAASALSSRVTQVVGTGLRPQAKIRDDEDKAADDLNGQLEDLFGDWALQAGFDGETLPELQRMIEASIARDGEAFILFLNDPTADSPIPLKLQLIAAERVETPPEQASNPNVRLGIETDAKGRVVAYWVRTTHPGDTVDNSPKHERITRLDKQGRPRLVHLFDKLYAGQRRGFPWFAPVMAALKDLKDFDEAELVAAQVAACFSVFIKSDNAYPLAVNSASATNSDGSRLQELSPGAVTYLDNAEDVQFATPNRPGNSYGPFLDWQLLGTAAGLNWPFAWLVKDYRRATFSSARLGEIDGGTHVRYRQQQLRDKFLGLLWGWFVDWAVLLGEVDIDPAAYSENRRQYRRHRWIGAGRPWIDPLKEVTASEKALQNLLTTYGEELGARGLDFEDVIQERARENARMRELGLPVPGEMTGQPGQPQPAQPASGGRQPPVPSDEQDDTEPQDEPVDEDAEVAVG